MVHIELESERYFLRHEGPMLPFAASAIQIQNSAWNAGATRHWARLLSRRVLLYLYGNRIVGVPLKSERRSTTHLPTNKGAAVVFGIRRVECSIRDLSERGAALAVADTEAIPDEFTLSFKQNGVKRACRVVWRASRKLGVQFV